MNSKSQRWFRPFLNKSHRSAGKWVRQGKRKEANFRGKIFQSESIRTLRLWKIISTFFSIKLGNEGTLSSLFPPICLKIIKPEWQTAVFLGSRAMHGSHFFSLQVMLLCRWNKLKGMERRKIIASCHAETWRDPLVCENLKFRLCGANMSSTSPRS